MKSLQAKIWHPGQPILACHNIFLKKDYKKIKKTYRKQQLEGSLPVGSRYYVTLPNGQDHIALIQEHINNENINTTHPDQMDTVPAVLNNLTEAISELSHTRIDEAVYLAKKHKLPGDIYSVLDFISEINNCIIFWLESKSPFIFFSPDPKNKAWWRNPPRAKGNINNIGHRIRKFYEDNIPVQLDGLLIWLKELEKHLNLFCENRLIGWGISDALKQASAYCGGVAERQLLYGDHNLSIIFFHRSVDLMLYSICAEQNLVDFSKNSGFGVYKNEPKKLITLNNSMEILESYLHKSSSRDSTFNELNFWRNQLIQTHYLTSADRDIADKLAIKVRSELKDIATPAWIKARDFFSYAPELTYRNLININNCTTSVYKEVLL